MSLSPFCRWENKMTSKPNRIGSYEGNKTNMPTANLAQHLISHVSPTPCNPVLDIKATLLFLGDISQPLQKGQLCGDNLFVLDETQFYAMDGAIFLTQGLLSIKLDFLSLYPPHNTPTPLLHDLFHLQEHRELTFAIGFAPCNLKCHPQMQYTRRL